MGAQLDDSADYCYQLPSTRVFERFGYTKIEYPFHKEYMVLGDDVVLTIQEIHTHGEYAEWGLQRLKPIEGCLHVYESDSTHSLYDLNNIDYNKFILLQGDTEFPKMLVGIQNDLKNERQVSFEERRDFADQFGSLFRELSAKSHEDLDKMFFGFLREIREYRVRHPRFDEEKAQNRLVGDIPPSPEHASKSGWRRRSWLGALKR